MMLEGGSRKALDVADRAPWEAGNASAVADAAFVAPGSSFPSVPLRLLIDPPAAGPWNMAVDEALLEAADQGQCTLRFYQWDRPTLSLGYFQSYADRWQHAPSCVCTAVRRSSGGGAILHDNELTYSLAAPAAHPLAADRLGLYRAMHAALIAALTQWDIHATLCAPHADAANHGAPRAAEPFLCFLRRAPGDVLLHGCKIAGSAQRRYRGAVLQHGSVLLGRSAAAPELPGIEELTGRRVEPQPLLTAWLDRLFALRIVRTVAQLPSQQHLRATELVHCKYGETAWTEHRGRAQYTEGF